MYDRDKYFLEINSSIQNNDLLALDILIANAININTVDKDGNTVLHIATALGSCSAMLRILDANAKVDITNNQGRTPLHVATSCDNFTAANILIAHGSDVNAQDSLGFTPLHFISSYDSINSIKVVHLLCECKADINILNSKLVSPLTSAIMNGSYCITTILLPKSKNQNSQEYQKTLLQMSTSVEPDIRNISRRFSSLQNATSLTMDR